jgi:2-oxoglutarate dehydrogenase E1 component
MALPSKRRGKRGAICERVRYKRELTPLVYAYRILGHTIARVNPLAEKRPENPLLTLREFGFSDKDLDYPVSSKFFLDNRQMSLREMIALLDQIYAGSIGAEFQHIQNTRIRRLGAASPRIAIFARPPSPEIQVALLRALLESETFEVFLHQSYVGQKRFSLQGAEGLMAILDTLLHKCVTDGGSRKSAWAWPIVAVSMCWQISSENRSTSSSLSLPRITFPLSLPGMAM